MFRMVMDVQPVKYHLLKVFIAINIICKYPTAYVCYILHNTLKTIPINVDREFEVSLRPSTCLLGILMPN